MLYGLKMKWWTICRKEFSQMRQNKMIVGTMAFMPVIFAIILPLVYIAGDAGICEEATSLNAHITTTAVKQGVGDSTVSIHPHLAVDRIREGAQRALEGDLSKCLLQMPKRFYVEIEYRSHVEAYRASFYPGAKQVSPHAIQFESGDYFEVLRLISFVI